MKKVIFKGFLIIAAGVGFFFYNLNRAIPVVSQPVGFFDAKCDADPVIITQEDATIQAIETVSDAIVGVINLKSTRPQGEGSGVIYKVERGDTYIVTNEHVVKGGDYFEVVFSDGQRMEAHLVGSDMYTDLAVLRLKNFEAGRIAEFGHTEDLKIGQTVIAIGNPLGLNFAGSATSGIVSGHDRSISIRLEQSQEDWEMTVLQTDAAINPGNSGGALINLKGEVVGINSMKISSTQIEGMSFSIPTYIVGPIISDLQEFGSVLRPTLGIQIRELNTIPARFKELLNIPTEQRSGIYVENVQKGTLGERIGLRSEDVIVSIGEIEVKGTLSFRKELFNYREGETLTITVLRNGLTIPLSTEIYN